MANPAAKDKKAKQDKKEVWESFSEENYQSAIENLVHFSTKAVNSNAAFGGIRLSGSQALDLPYVAISTFAPQKVHLDYMKNVGKTSKIFKQSHAVMTGTANDRFDNVPNDEECFIRDAYAGLLAMQKVGSVDCRLKQLIMPDEAGNDSQLTPLHSSGFCDALSSAIEVETDARKSLISESDEKKKEWTEKRVEKVIRYAKMPFGGANPQNIGGLIRRMQKPLFFMPPVEDMDMKRLFSIFHNGIEYVSNKRIEEYLDWRDQQSRVDDKYRTTEEGMIQALVNVALHRGRQAHEFLLENQEKLGDSLLSNEVGLVGRGVILTKERDAAWRNAFAFELAEKITKYSRKRVINGRQESVDSGIGSDEKMRLVSLISKMVLA